MRSPIPALLFAALFGFYSTASADVTLRVEQETKETATPKTFTSVQKRTLRMFLSNESPNEATLKVRYAFFGHALTDHTILTVNQGEVPATVKPRVVEQVDTPSFSSTSVLEHYVKGVKGKVPATGDKLVGYGVQVLLDDKIVAEAYEPPSMKEQMDKAPVPPAAGKATPAPAKKGTPAPAKKGTPAPAKS